MHLIMLFLGKMKLSPDHMINNKLPSLAPIIYKESLLIQLCILIMHLIMLFLGTMKLSPDHMINNKLPSLTPIIYKESLQLSRYEV